MDQSGPQPPPPVLAFWPSGALGGPPGGPLVVCEHDRQLGGEKSSIQPDGGEGLAKRKGVVAEAGSEGSVEQSRGPMDKKPDNEAYPAGRASN